MNVKKISYMAIGSISLALGALGAVLPLLPAVPFLLLAAICFARSSEKLHNWFLGTSLYRKNLDIYVAGRGMTRQTKIISMVTLTLIMAVSFAFMHQVLIGRMVLIGVWVFHVLYFLFGVKTIPAKE